MKNNLNLTIIFLTLLLLQGCAEFIFRTAFTWGRTVELKNNEGHAVDCTVSKTSAMFRGNRDRGIEQCVLSYEKQGYKRLEQ